MIPDEQEEGPMTWEELEHWDGLKDWRLCRLEKYPPPRLGDDPNGCNGIMYIPTWTRLRIFCDWAEVVSTADPLTEDDELELKIMAVDLFYSGYVSEHPPARAKRPKQIRAEHGCRPRGV
jgi:hypothetical protein